MLNLGELPETAFERTFCRRLERTLELAFTQYLADPDRQGLWKRAPQAECQALLEQTLHAADEAPDSWLLRQLENGPDIWWPVLASYALCPEGAALYRRLRQKTVRHLCAHLAPDIPVQGGLTEDSLWLSALLYFHHHPQLPMPQVPIVPRPGAPPVLDAALYAGPGRPHDVRLITALFEYQAISASHSVSMRPWLRHLWLSPVVFDRVSPTLAARQVTWWHTQLTGAREGLAERRGHTEGGRPAPQPTEAGGQWPAPQLGERPAAPGVLRSHTEAERSVEQKYAANRVPPPGCKVPENASVWEPVSHAGMALLWPLLPGLFRQLGLLKGKRFISQQAQHQAAACLDWLAGEGSTPQEPPTISRWLCELTREYAIVEDVGPDDAMQEMLGHWLAGLPLMLPATWQKLSPEDIRQWFLRRPGWLSADPGQFILHVQPEVFDVLLKDWPWPVNLAALPWLDQPLTVRWTAPQ
ncbi:hypothetical protein WJ88_00315 [Burkholderia ubonensis]|nr:hypothetical protein WJ88_00315 [Burkholderia ubonensis]